MLYRSTKEPIAHPGELGGYLPYFQNHAPGEWIFDERYWPEFERLYGRGALELAKTMIVPENIDPTAVGGTYWNDPARRRREIFFDVPEPEKPLVPGPDEEIVQTPFGPKIVKRPPKKALDLTVSEFLQLLRSVLQ